MHRGPPNLSVHTISRTLKTPKPLTSNPLLPLEWQRWPILQTSRRCYSSYHGKRLSVEHVSTGNCFRTNLQTRSMTWLGEAARSRLWHAQRSRSEPELTEAQLEAERNEILERAMQGRQPTDLMLRCTVLDAEGNVKTISGQFKRSELSMEHELNPRDLRKIDSRIPNLVPTILSRKAAILVNILHIRALIKSDMVILFDTYGSTDSRIHSIFLYHLEHNLRQKSNTPYEFRALESVMLSVLSALEAELVFTRKLIGGLLAELEDNIDRDKFKRLLHYSRRLQSFSNRARLVQQALEEVVENDDDLDAMYLTDRRAGVERHGEHEELEVLMESFSKQVEEIVNETETMSNNVSSTQEIVELILDSNRNALLALDLKISIVTMGLGTGTLFAGLFGMNLQSHLEDNAYAFLGMSGLAVIISAVAAWRGLHRLAAVRKVGLATNNQKQRRPWLPLPLRRRGPGEAC